MQRARHSWIEQLVWALFVAVVLVVSPVEAAKKCYDCHSKAKAEFTSKKSVHDPVKAENCESCHKRHGFANNLVLTDESNQLCYTCHADLKDKYATGSVHFPVGNRNCWECHDPHSSDKKALLRTGPAGADDPNFCLACHGNDLAKPGTAAHKHAPYEKLECTTCHDAHNSEHRGLLKSAATDLCQSCHKLESKQIAAAHEGKFITGLACSDCHSGHSNNKPGLMSDRAHAPFAEGSCDACHSLPDASGKITFDAGVTAGNTCQNCHADQAAGPTKAHPHAAVEAENCDNCHSAHSSSHDKLLKKTEAEICGECHTDLIHDTTIVAHMPVLLGECSSCHDVHGSDNPKLAKATDNSLCLGCHTEFVAARDSATTVHAGAEDCSQCHAPHQGVTGKLLKDTPNKLCKSCHEVDPGANTSLSQHGPYMEQDCAACHEPHHTKTKHLVRKEGTALCLSCHDDVALRLAMPTKHPPAQDGCEGCHTPHFSKEKALLTDKTGPLCLSCHTAEDINATKGHVHTPVADGDCMGCHNAHGSVKEGLIVGRMQPVATHGVAIMRPPALGDRISDLCYTCHETLETKFREGTMHSPVIAGECDKCHVSHGSDHRGFIADKPSVVCGSCHTLDADLKTKHKGYELADADCADCHNPHNSKRPKLLRENDHPPFADGSCEACHSQKPDGTVELVGDMNTMCGTCHDMVATESAKAVPHAPFVGGQCNDCHMVHSSDFTHLLRDDGNKLCLTCHTDMRDLQKSPVQHKPFGEGKCLDCHRPHASEFASLTTKPAATFCISCHKDLKEKMAKGIVHAPARTGDCGSCHEAHAGTNKALLTKDKQDLCAGCHNPTSPALAAAHHGFDMADVDCQNCHEAHVSPKGAKALLLPKAHAPFVGRDCNQCHQPSGERELTMPGKQLCLSCHADFQKEMMRAVVHAPVASEDGCTGCHGPHVGYGKSLQTKDGVETCLTCHNTNEFTGQFKHEVAFQDCGNCHQPHSANYKGLLSTPDIMELCMNCHDDVKKTHYHPMGKEVINPRTQQPLDCIGCHSAHSSNHKAILIADKNRKLCVNCHDVSES